MDGKRFVFGNNIIEILSHTKTDQNGIIDHYAKLEITGHAIDRVYLKHEIIDLVAYHVGSSPLHAEIIHRDAQKLNDKHYTIQWEEIRRAVNS